MRRHSTGAYPPDWNQIARAIKDAAGWTCVRCGHPHDPGRGYTLTVHHLDLNPANCAWWNCPALCQRCHLSIQGRVVMERVWVLEHSAWFEPFAGGYFAKRYLGLDLSREEVEADLGRYLRLEQDAVLGPRLIDQEAFLALAEEAQADGHSPVGAEQGAPRLRPGEER